MQKVYLLLRDNKQSGPYSLDEILQLGLRPFDLIWVEGRSCGWSYPSEINTLKPYVPEAPAPVQPKSTESISSTPPAYTPADTATSSSPKVIPPPKNVFISMPGKGAPSAPPKEVAPPGDWDRRVEEVRQRAQVYTPVTEKEEDTPSLNTNYARSLNEVEEEYTSWVYNQKAKKKPAFSERQVAALVIGIILLGGGYLVFNAVGDAVKKDKEAVGTLRQPLREEAQLPQAEEEPVGSAVVYEDRSQPQENIATTTGSRKEEKKAIKPLTIGAVAHKPAAQPVPEQGPTPQSPQTINTATAEPKEETVASAPPSKEKDTR